jgi:hypothetical protein
MGLSPYWLRTGVQVGPNKLDNVIRLTAQLTSEDVSFASFDGVIVVYLQRDFKAVYSYDLATNAITKRAGTYASHDPLIRCTNAGDYCLGMYVRPARLGKQAYYYAMTRPPTPYNGMLGEDTVQVTYPTTSVDKGDKLTYEQYLAVGSRARVAATLKSLHAALG